jgi:hypothetical protein
MEYSVFVVVRQREQWTDYGDEKWNEVTVQDLAFTDREMAEKRAAHLNKEKLVAYATVHPVKVWIDPPAPQYVPMPYPVTPSLPPSAVYTSEDPDVKLQVAYDVPRRVFRQKEPSLSSVISGAWSSWAAQQAAQGNFESASEGMTEAARLFEVSPEGQLRLYPRDLPTPAH